MNNQDPFEGLDQLFPAEDPCETPKEVTATPEEVVEDDEMTAVLKEAEKEVGDMEKAAGENAQPASESKSEESGQLSILNEADNKPDKTSGCAAQTCGTNKNSKKAKKTASSTCSAPPKPKEPENDLDRLVVLTNYNEQKSFPKEMTLEQIRGELEKEYPAYSKENTNWYFEKQADNNRYLCIPSYKSNKAG